jgi:hypothetical protein
VGSGFRIRGEGILTAVVSSPGMFHMGHCTLNSGSWTVDHGQWFGVRCSGLGESDENRRTVLILAGDATGRGPVFRTRGQIYMGLCEKI